MTVHARPEGRELALAPLEENADHVRGAPADRLIIEYGDYQCPYSRQAFRAIERAGREPGGTPRRLRPAHPARRAGPMSRPARMPRRAVRE